MWCRFNSSVTVFMVKRPESAPVVVDVVFQTAINPVHVCVVFEYRIPFARRLGQNSSACWLHLQGDAASFRFSAALMDVLGVAAKASVNHQPLSALQRGQRPVVHGRTFTLSVSR